MVSNGIIKVTIASVVVFIIYLAQTSFTCQYGRHLLQLAVQVELLAIFENFSIRLVCCADQRWHSFRNSQLILARHNISKSLCTLPYLFIFFCRRVSLLSFRTSRPHYTLWSSIFRHLNITARLRAHIRYFHGSGRFY